MNAYPFSSPGFELLLSGMSHGDFDKAAESSYMYESCQLCKRKFVAKEVRFVYPSKVELKGTDLPFDLSVDDSKMCLLCFVKVGELMGSAAASLKPKLEYAALRIEQDKPSIYVPAALADEPKEAAKPI